MPGVAAAAAFVFGVIWLKMQLWPYQLIAESQFVESARNRSDQSAPKIIRSRFVDLKLDEFEVDVRLPIERFGVGIDAFVYKVLVMSRRGEFYLYQTTRM